MDTGLCAWLCGWTSPEVLKNGAMAGAILETWAYGQLCRSFANRGIMPRMCYYRDGRGSEVDFLIEQDGCIFPLEVKRSSSPTLADLKAAATIPLGNAELKPGVVLCSAMEMFPLGKGNYAFPISAM
jgi:predicted AAA+ superfamily ATPase